MVVVRVPCHLDFGFFLFLFPIEGSKATRCLHVMMCVSSSCTCLCVIELSYTCLRVIELNMFVCQKCVMRMWLQKKVRRIEEKVQMTEKHSLF